MGVRGRQGRLVVGIVLSLVGTARAQAPGVVSGSGETVNGVGERTRVTVIRPIMLRSDGRVSGELEFQQYVRNAATGAVASYVTRERVQCMELYHRQAWVGTVVTASTNPGMPRGAAYGVWYFEDNDGNPADRVNALHGQGNGATLCADGETQYLLLESATPLIRGRLFVHD
jgi:hypothetical protein